MKKLLLILLLQAFLVLHFSKPVLAQSTSSVRTKVGNPPNNGQDTLEWAQKISSALEPGFDGSNDKMVANISNAGYTAPQSVGTSSGNKYWCTYLVIDAFNLAGHTGLNRASHGGAVYMMGFWKSNGNYVFLDYYNSSHQDVLKQVQPGYSIIFQDNPGTTTIGDFDHAAMVYSINVNAHGDGVIETLDANLPAEWGKTITYPISAWDIKGTLRGSNHPNYSIMGFGTTKS